MSEYELTLKTTDRTAGLKSEFGGLNVKPYPFSVLKTLINLCLNLGRHTFALKSKSNLNPTINYEKLHLQPFQLLCGAFNKPRRTLSSN